MRIFCITIFLLFLFSLSIFPQDYEIKTKVTVSIYPQIITAGNPFTLSILADHPSPDEVSIIMPPFEGSFILDRYVRTPRVSSAGVTQTLFEFRLIPNESGRIVIGPLSVLSPYGVTETEPIVVNIRDEFEERNTARRLVWESIPAQAAAGDRVTLTLRVDLSRSGNIDQLPPPSFFMPEVPQGVILSNSSITTQERERGVVLKLTLIPLSAGSFNLPARTLQREKDRFEIPALNIRITEKLR